MSDELTPQQLIEKHKAEIIFNPLNSAEELRNWIYMFFDVYMPMGHVYHESNSSPIEAAWEIYCAVRDNTGDKIPGYIILSCRSGYKTLVVSMLEILLMLHFRVTIAHCAAILDQSQKAVEYCGTFINKTIPYLEAHGWKQTSDNKRRIEFTTDTKDKVYIQIIVLTDKGANSAHTNIMCVDGINILDCKRISNTDYSSNRSIQKLSASSIYKRLENGDKVELLTFNFATGEMEFQQPFSWFETRKDTYRIKTDSGSDRGMYSLDHKFFVIGKGTVPLSEVKIGDKIPIKDKRRIVDNLVNEYKVLDTSIDYSKIEYNQEDFIDQVILGSLLGDGGLYKKEKGNAYFKEQHGLKQSDYLNWKKDTLSQKFRTHYTNAISGFTGRDIIGFATGQTPELNKYVGFKRNFNGIERLGPLSLLIWYLDDGNTTGFRFNSQSFTLEQNQQLQKILKEKFDIDTKIAFYKSSSTGNIQPVLNGDYFNKYKLYKICEPYLNDLMPKKFEDIKSKIKTCELCGRPFLQSITNNFSKICGNSLCQGVENSNFKIETVQEIYLDRKNRRVYDFNTPNHNFISNGILVHNCVDEVDLCNPRAYEEAKKIPNYERGRHPLTIYLSTRKYAFGLMERAIKEMPITGNKLLRWNIMDITEKCPKEKAKTKEPKQIRYIPIILPLEQLTEEQFNSLDDSKKHNYQKIECYAGCTECKLLSVCKMILHDKTPKECVGDLYKPPVATINDLRKGDVDVNEAQLLCHKPASSGLIYPRFSEKENVVDVRTAWEMISGATHETNFDLLINYVKNLGVRIESGLDWGFSNQFAMVQGVIMPGNKIFIFDTFAAPGLELDDEVRIGLEIKQKFGTKKIWPDPAYPANIKTFNRKGLKCGKFEKDVAWGIECGRERIVNSNNVRSLFIIDVPNNRKLIDAFKTYHWKVGADGEPTDKPDHTEESDIMDAFRYLLQNVSGNKKGVSCSIMGEDQNQVLTDNSAIMAKRIKDLATDDQQNPQNVAKRRFLLV